MLVVGISHIVICIAFFLLLRNNWQERITKTLLLLCSPIFGELFFLLTWARDLFIHKNKKIDYNGIITQYDGHYQFIKQINYKKEINVISLEEALIVNEDKIKRNVILDVLKRETVMYIDFLKKALDNPDSETSHYAASAIMEIIRKFENTMQELSGKYESNRDDVKVADLYYSVIRDYINSQLCDEYIAAKYKYTLINVLENLIDNLVLKETQISKQNITNNTAEALMSESFSIKEAYYFDIIKFAIELKEYQKAQAYCEKYLNRFKNSENAYLVYLELYYMLGLPNDFKKLLNQLKASKVQLSNRGINTVRFWSGGIVNDTV